MERCTVEKSVENCFPWERPHPAAEEECEEPFPEEEEAPRTRDELSTAPLPVPMRVRRERNQE